MFYELRDHRTHVSQVRLLYPAKLSITIDRERKYFTRKTNLSNFYPSIQFYRRYQKESFSLHKERHSRTTNQGGGEFISQQYNTRNQQHCSSITLNIHGLNFPNKKTKSNRFDQRTGSIQETHCTIEDGYQLRVKELKKVVLSKWTQEVMRCNFNI